MPDIETGTKPIAFGDFSYYWNVGRKPVSVRTLLENLYCMIRLDILHLSSLTENL